MSYCFINIPLFPLSRWFSKASKQEAGEEIVNGLKSCFVHALRKYYEVNHELPGICLVFDLLLQIQEFPNKICLNKCEMGILCNITTARIIMMMMIIIIIIIIPNQA